MTTLAARSLMLSVVAVAACELRSAAQTAQVPAATPPYAAAWSQVVDAPGQPRLAVGASLVFVCSAESGLSAYSPADGLRVWRSEFTSDLPPVATGEIVAMLTPKALVVLDQQSGETRWQVPIDTWPPQPRLQAADGLLLAALGEAGHELRAWRLDGTEAWRRDLGGAIVTPVAASAQSFFIGLASPAVVALDTQTGAVRWRLPLPTEPTSLGAAGDRLYLSGADGALYSFRQTGDPKPAWRYRLLEAIGEPVMSERHVYFTLIDNTVRALDRKGGSQRWSRQLPTRAATGPMLLGDALIVPLTNGRVSYLSTSNGAVGPAAEPSEATSRLRLQSVAPSADGMTVFTIAAAGDDTRTLTAWRRSPPKGTGDSTVAPPRQRPH